MLLVNNTPRQHLSSLLTFIVRAICLISLAGACTLYGSNGSSGPVSIILDTDLASDCDDAAAIAVLHSLADLGEAEILATGVSAVNPFSVLALDALNTFYGRPDVPIGTTKDVSGRQRESAFAEALAREFPRAHSDWTDAGDAPDAVAVYREVLAAQPDIDEENAGVVFVSIGYMTNMQNLLQSPGDEISSLDGSTLVERKVRLWVCMGGRFPSGNENNILGHSAASAYAFDNWPTPVVFSGWEVGNEIITGTRLQHLEDPHPVKRAYELAFDGSPLADGRASWDQATVLYAVRGIDGGGASEYWELSEPGMIEVDVDDGSNAWREDSAGQQRYKIEATPPASIAMEIDTYMAQPWPFVGGNRVGLIAYYPFTEGGGETIQDHSGVSPALDLSLSGGAHWASEGSGVVFDGKTGKLQTEESATKLFDQIHQTGEFSIEVWAEAAESDQEGPARIISYSPGLSVRNFALGHGAFESPGPDLTVRLRTTGIGDHNGGPDITGEDAISAGKNHYAVTYDGETVRIYRNGKLHHSEPREGALDYWDRGFPLVIGNEATGSRGWAGTLWMVAIYDTELSGDEVEARFVAGPESPPESGNTSFEQWLVTEFPETDLSDPDAIDPLRDPGGQGIPNIIRYALVLDPHQPRADDSPHLDVEENGGSDYLTVTFRRRKNAVDTEIFVEASGDLMTWERLGDEAIIDVVEDGELEKVTVRDSVPVETAWRRYLRISVEVIE